MWKLDSAWKVRSWQASRALRDLNASVYDARTRETASGRAREGAPERNAALGARVGTLEPRVDSLSLRVENAKGAQARRLADIAVRELEDQRKRLDEYSIQARYALATIYDRAAAGTAPAKPQAGAAMSRALVAAIALALAPLGALAGKAPPPPPTLKDLKRATPEIRTGETVAPDPDRAKELYRRFLELEGGDPALRTEAMRRLGDLQIESRGQRARRDRGTGRGGDARGDRDLHPPARAAAGVRARRRRALPARPRLGIARRGGQGARLPRHDGGDLSRRARASTRPSSAAARSCSAPSAIPRPRRPTRPRARSARRASSTSRASTSSAGRCSSSPRTRRRSIPSCACST